MKKPLIIGLTGGIGAGKSTAARILQRLGFPIYNADHVVHALLQKGGEAVPPVARLFPSALNKGAIDRSLLGALVFGRPRELRKLERILHPLVHEAEKSFIKKARRQRKKAVILEIPLLFETGGQKRCDFTLCVTASRALQKHRVLARKGMTETKLKAILRHQMPNARKRKLADYVVRTDKGYADTQRQLKECLKKMGL